MLYISGTLNAHILSMFDDANKQAETLFDQMPTQRERNKSEIPTQVRLLLELHRLESDKNGSNDCEETRRIESDLDPSLAKRYRRVKEKRRTGIAVLRGGVCTGCNMAYPEAHEIFQYRNFVRTCEYCGRLLVVIDEPPRTQCEEPETIVWGRQP
jgi:predicted  nucleic acid-binding Zn-ribbon protein